MIRLIFLNDGEHPLHNLKTFDISAPEIEAWLSPAGRAGWSPLGIEVLDPPEVPESAGVQFSDAARAQQACPLLLDINRARNEGIATEGSEARYIGAPTSYVIADLFRRLQLVRNGEADPVTPLPNSATDDTATAYAAEQESPGS